MISRDKHRTLLKIAWATLGFLIGLFSVFMVLFLYKVLPHGGF